ncbi:MAG: ankyrin repeat domain-containing protein [Pseudomonadota bacterium]
MKASYQHYENSQQEQDPYGKSKIFKAIEESNVKDLAIAIFAGGNVNQCTIYVDSPLQIALCSETIRPNIRSAIVSQLLRANADLNYIIPSEEGNSVAMLFFTQLDAGNQLHPFVSLLVEHGANLQIKNEAGLTGHDILESKYPSAVLAEVPGFYPIHVNPSEKGTDDAEGVYYIAEGALRLYTTSDYLECLSSLAGQDNQHDSDDFLQ